MLRYTTLAIAAALATYTPSVAAATHGDTAGTGGVFFHLPNHHGVRSLPLLAARQRGSTGADLCTGGQTPCDSSCIDAGFQCCHVGQGQACQEGYSCYDQGCCRHGKTCSGPPRGCTATTKVCDVGCIPRDRVCCGLGDGSSCDPGTVCLASGFCGTPVSNGGGSMSSGGQAQTPTSSPSPSSAGSGTSVKTLPPTSIGASVTSGVEVSSGSYTLTPVKSTTTTTTAAGGVSSEAPASDKTKPTMTTGDSSASGDKGAAGTTLEAPAILAGLLAVAAYFI